MTAYALCGLAAMYVAPLSTHTRALTLYILSRVVGVVFLAFCIFSLVSKHRNSHKKKKINYRRVIVVVVKRKKASSSSSSSLLFYSVSSSSLLLLRDLEQKSFQRAGIIVNQSAWTDFFFFDKKSVCTSDMLSPIEWTALHIEPRSFQVRLCVLLHCRSIVSRRRRCVSGGNEKIKRKRRNRHRRFIMRKIKLSFFVTSPLLLSSSSSSCFGVYYYY